MLIDFNELVEHRCPGINNGTGMMSAKMYIYNGGRQFLALFMRVAQLVFISTKQAMIITTFFPAMEKQFVMIL